MTLLVLDIGTSSVRALLFDDAVQQIPGAATTRQHHFSSEEPGAAIFDANPLQNRVEACIDEILEHPAARAIHAVGMDTLVGNLVGVDDDNQPVTPVYIYADTRAAEDVDMLADRIDLTAQHQRTGCRLHTAYHPARLHWLRRTQPDQFARVRRWLDIGSLLIARWFGQPVCSYSVASWSGLLNRAELTWDREWLDLLELDIAQFAHLGDYNTVQTGLRDQYADRWPALRDVPFALAVGDGAAANVGSTCVDQSQIALTVGTTAALRTVSQANLPPVPDGLWSYRVTARHHLIGGATSEGGNIFQWLRDTLKLPWDNDELEAELLKRSPDQHGLTLLPLLAGERSPGWATGATGAINGLRLSTTSLDIAQAALEGVALRLALINEQLSAVTTADARMIASGGALQQSAAFTQMIANALDRPLDIAAAGELTARGAALLARDACGMGHLSDLPVTIVRTVEPQPQPVERFRAARQRQMHLYRQLIDEAAGRTG